MGDELSWIDADGTEHPLTATPQFRKLQGWIGRFMPPISFVEDEVPLQPGARLRNVKTTARDVDIPIMVKGTGEIDLRNNIRLLLQYIDPNRGDGRLRITAPDGSQRDLYCRYSSGMEGHESKDTTIPWIWMTLILTFRAFDPYWYGVQTQVQTYTTGQPATFFPFFPLRLSSSSVFADATINNQGDVETWPEWVITGPGSQIVLHNLTTGETITLNVTLGIGETVTIDTSPGNKTVKKNDGTNLYSQMTFDSSLWAIQKGSNSIQIEMSSSTTTSSVQLTFRERYLGA